MANKTAALVLRVKIGEKYPYLRPATTTTGKVRPNWGLVNGVPTRFAEVTYYVRFTQDRKLKLMNVGSDLDVALVELRKRSNLLEARLVGNAVADDEQKPRERISVAIEQYCAEITARKSKKTADGYERVLRLFERGCRKSYLDELERQDLIDFAIQMRKAGLSNRTSFNYLGYTDTFLRKCGVPKLLRPHDWPKFVEKKVTVYHREDLQALLAAADEEFRLVLRFFLGSGCREGEVAHAHWRDLNFRTGEHLVCAKPELGFCPPTHPPRGRTGSAAGCRNPRRPARASFPRAAPCNQRATPVPAGGFVPPRWAAAARCRTYTPERPHP